MRTSNRQNPFARPLAARRGPLTPKGRGLFFMALVGAASAGCMPGALPGQNVNLHERDKLMDRGQGADVRETRMRTGGSVDEQVRRHLDEAEKAVLHALKVAQGQEPPDPGGKTSTLAQNVPELRAKKMRLAVVPAERAGDDNYYLDGKAYGEGIVAAGRSLSANDRNSLDQKFFETGKHITTTSAALYRANFLVQQLSVNNMVRAAMIVRENKKYGIEWNADDYALVGRGLENGRRAEALAAAATGLFAGYQAVIKDNKNPKGVEQLAAELSKAFPVEAKVSDDEAKKYVERLSDQAADAKQRYEKWIRAVYGDLSYERDYKQWLDKSFAEVEEAQNTRARADVAEEGRRKRAAERQAAQGAGAGQGGGANVLSLLDAGGNALPSDSPLRSSLKGIAAIARGDAKGVIGAAIELVPAGPIKAGLGLALSIFG